MAIYEYSCSNCGPFDVSHPMGSASPTDRCVTCGETARRSFVAPLLNRTSQPIAAAVTQAERSRDQPEVVRSVPPPTRGRRSI
jgi:putative FmdB family regulatory protein